MVELFNKALARSAYASDHQHDLVSCNVQSVSHFSGEYVFFLLYKSMHLSFELGIIQLGMTKTLAM